MKYIGIYKQQITKFDRDTREEITSVEKTRELKRVSN